MYLNQKLSQISQDDFNFLIKNGARSSKLLNFDFESLIYLKWGLLKETLPSLIQVGDLETLYFLMLKDRGVNVFFNDVQNIEPNKAMSFFLWIRDEMQSIQELENQYLRSDPDIKLLQAGINELDKFGLNNTLDNLAKGNILDYDKIRQLPYNVVFDKQYLEVTKGRIEKKLAKQK